jgi:hypothetical protein
LGKTGFGVFLEEGVVECFIGVDSVFGVEYEHFVNEVDE